MESNRKLFKLLFRFPATFVYGNEGDFSRYKFLRELTTRFTGKEHIVNKYIRDKVNILVYPRGYGEELFAVSENEIHIVKEIGQLKEKNYEWILVPGEVMSSDEIFVFPVTEDWEQFLNIREVMFIESFPFGKKEFYDMVFDCIIEQDITCHKVVVLFEEDRKFGATDISDENAGIEGVYKKLRCYVDEICKLSDFNLGNNYRDVKKQYVRKKRVQLRTVRTLFTEGYNREYEFLRQRWLCNEEKMGILTDSTFEYISDYKYVKNSDNVEMKMFNNLLEHISKQKKDICNVIRELLSMYLINFKSISDEEVEKYYERFIRETRNSYKLGDKKSCPNNKLDYRILCSNERYVIKLRKHLKKMLEKYLYLEIHRDIRKELDDCEVNYYEKIKV